METGRAVRPLAVTLLCLALAGSPSGAATAAAAAAAGAAPHLRVAARISGKFVSPLGSEPPGFDVEILRRFAAWHHVKAGVQPQLDITEAANVPVLLEAVQKGADLGIGGVTATTERAKLVDFSIPILPVRSVLIAPPEVLAPETWRQHIKGLRVGATVGSTNAAEVEKLATAVGGLKVNTTFATNEAVFDALVGAHRSLDAAVVDLPQYWTTGKQHGLVLVDSLGEPLGMAIVLHKGSPWKPLIDQFLESFTHSSDYFQIIRRYFGNDAEQMVRMSKGSR